MRIFGERAVGGGAGKREAKVGMERSARETIRREARRVWIGVFALLCVWPFLGRLGYPSLYGDDVVRIASERVVGLPRLLFQPFNEHMAPAFQALTSVCWALSFDRLTRAAIALTWASYPPFFMSVILLYRVLRDETGSTTASATATAAFSLSWLPVETIGWYSASSFMWSLFWSLVAWRSSARSSAADSSGSAFGARMRAGVAAGLSPCFSAIGLLAGPLAAIRAAFGSSPRGRRDVAAPCIGTLVYIIVCLCHRYGGHVAENVARKGNFRMGFLAAAVAPSDVLIPALFGVGNLHAKIPETLAVSATIGLAAIALAWSSRSRFRPLIWGGLILIAGGYAMTYLVRTSVVRVDGVLETQRYHLFPHLGLCFIFAAVTASSAIVRRIDRRENLAWAFACLFALAMNATHDRTIRDRMNFYRYADQSRSLAALDKTADICLRERITRAQVLRAFDPVLTKWFPYEGFNQLELLPPTSFEAVRSDAEARRRILEALSIDEREALLGGMDASKHVIPSPEGSAGPILARGKARKPFRARELAPGRYESSGWPSYLEYEMIGFENAGSARFLRIVGGRGDETFPLSWNLDGDRWSETRRVRLKVPRAWSAAGWAIRLDDLPHWRTDRARRIRIGIESAGPIRLDSVEFRR